MLRRFLPVSLSLLLAALSAPAAETPVDLGDGDRVLVVSAHLGDEILSCAGLLQEANDLDLPVQVACLTTGEPDEFFAWFVPGRKPRREALSRQLREASERRSCTLDAAEALGLREAQYVFLGYPSGGLATLWREVWRDAPGWVSPRGRAQTATWDVRTPGAPFTAKALLADVAGSIRDFAPTHLFVPSPLEASGDHRAAHAFVRAALLDLEKEGVPLPAVYTYFTHAADWPAARADDAGPLVPPEGEADRLAEDPAADIATLRLAPFQRERAAKARAALALPPAGLAARYAASDERFPAAPEAAGLPAFESAYGETRYGAEEAFLALAGAARDDLDARDEARALADKAGNAFVGLEAEDAGEATRVTLQLARPKAPGVEVVLWAYAAGEGFRFGEREDALAVRRTYDADRPDDAREFTFYLEKLPGETHRIVSAALAGAHGLPLDDFPPVVLRTGETAARQGPEPAPTFQNPPENAPEEPENGGFGPENAGNPPWEAVSAPEPDEKAPETAGKPAEKAPNIPKKKKDAPRAEPAARPTAADRPMAW